MLHSNIWRELVLLVYCFCTVCFGQHAQEHLLITAPPSPAATECPHKLLQKRQRESCPFGPCGTTCLEQGAFCCGPAGPLATSPFWLCDNGACITSVRATTGIVDCYDPDNPSGTTQSCLDEKATSSCASTDRCYTCSADQPYCRWETYIETNSPTLRWFSCIETKDADLTFYASTITGNLTSSSPSSTRPSVTASSTTQSQAQKDDSLSTGAIIGISVAGGVVLIGAAAALVYCCIRRRKTRTPRPQELDPNSVAPPMRGPPPLMELDARDHPRSELGGSTVYSPSSPFTPFEGYDRNTEGLDVQRYGTPTTRTDQQVKDWYFSEVQQPPRELPDWHGRRE